MDDENAKSNSGVMHETDGQGVPGYSTQEAEEAHRKEAIKRAQEKKKEWEAENNSSNMSWAGNSKDPNRSWMVGD